MRRKIVLLDEDLVKFALDRCAADLNIARLGVKLAMNNQSLGGARGMVDYGVKVERLRAALEAARDES